MGNKKELKLIKELLGMFSRNEISSVFSNKYCEINSDFIGFIEIYKHLSMIIPKHFTVVDFGCAYAPQCGYFSNHKQYIGVDTSRNVRFSKQNTIHYVETIEQHIYRKKSTYDIQETFAICSYVPSVDVLQVKEVFDNCFVYYPCNKEFSNKLSQIVV